MGPIREMMWYKYVKLNNALPELLKPQLLQIIFILCLHYCVQVPPALNDVSPSLLIHNEGDNVDLRCEATGTPTPNLTWFKDGRELTSSNHVTVVGRRVQLHSLRHGDAGVYTCTFKNIIGSASHTIKLVVRGWCELFCYCISKHGS